ncbi:MAG TPA: class I SAM-dependent methyltransferase [Gemmatimonadaceae bacterium]|nr:class I SAM-dependent methyltransferase [Gemmatimonadaceae bacterium]
MAIEHISDTARWVAVYRAMETERPDAIFRDPYARLLAGDRGEDIVNAMARGRSMAWAMIVRTALFDEIILDVLRQDRVDMVINLAAGLDARAWRMDLPADLRWVDVDLPEILAYKADVLRHETPTCRYEAVAADLREASVRQALFARLGNESHRALVVTEGLLVYLTEPQVSALATDLHAMRTFQWWLIDLASPRLLEIMRKYWGKAVERGSAPFLFGPAQGTAWFAPMGWREVQFRSTMLEGRRLRREMRGTWLWRFLSRLSSRKRQEEFVRMSGTVLLERR